MLQNLDWSLGVTSLSLPRSLFSAALCLLLSMQADGALVEVDDPVFGSSAVTLDTDAGLQWLDLTVTSGQSSAAIESRLSPGGDLSDWRYPAVKEVCSLFDSLNSADDLNCAAQGLALFSTSIEQSVAEQFIELFGVTSEAMPRPNPVIPDPDPFDISSGIFFGQEASIYWRAEVVPFSFNGGTNGLAFVVGVLMTDRDLPRPGHYLVRPVPVPGAAWLLASALVLLSYPSRVRRQPAR